MIDDTNYRLFQLATDRGNQENMLWGQRTQAFLTANSFLFVGVVVLLVSSVTLVLPIIVAGCGLWLCVLQNRNACAARTGADAWSNLRHEVEQQLGEDFAKPIQMVRRTLDLAWGSGAPTWTRMFIPRRIHEYWLPGTIATIWLSSIGVSGMMMTTRGI